MCILVYWELVFSRMVTSLSGLQLWFHGFPFGSGQSYRLISTKIMTEPHICGRPVWKLRRLVACSTFRSLL
jgi:hypothetical protein